MKKSSILAVCFLAGITASAQLNVVKDAESAMKSGKGYQEVVKLITPAMSDPETANLAQTYYVPGKAGFKEYDDLYGKKQFGQLKDGENITMIKALVGGYNNFVKALPLDSVADAKGKIKTKYSKEIISTIAGHYNDYNSAALDFWNEKDFKGAYEAWEIFLTMPENPAIAKSIKVYPDSTLSEVMYNQALAAWQSDDFALAAKAFLRAKDHGYTKKNLFEYGVAVAYSANDDETMLLLAREGDKLYGADDPQFMNQIINYYLKKEKYDEALNILDQALAENPKNAQYLALKGIIYTNKKDNAKAKEEYQKALAIDSENALANLYLGTTLAQEAGERSDAFNDRTDGDYGKFKKNILDPIYEQAAIYVEKAYQLDPNNRSTCITVLENIYYNLGDSRYDEIQQRKADL
jgi:tetratricopeptide (TPR) repeat protein